MLKKSKNCRVCKVSLSQSNSTYYRLRNYIYLCNDCDKEQKRIWAANKYKNNPSQSAKRMLDWQHKNALSSPVKHKCSQMYSSSLKRAKILGISHNITTEQLILIAPSHCPILKFNINYLSKRKDKYSPSLDRINPNEGYIIGNIQIISYLANLMKSFANEEELINFSDWVNSSRNT